MTSGWFADPIGRHEYRWYDGAEWSAHVSDSGATSLDPLPPAPGRPQQNIGDWTDAQLRAAAGWWRSRRATTPGPTGDGRPVLDDLESEPLLGPWSGLANAVSHYALATSGIAATGELLGILHAITGAQDAQTRLLRRIDAKVDALVLGPYQTGRTHLDEASRVGAADPTQREHINQAKECFYSAHGQAVSVQSRALVEYHLAMTWLLLDRRTDARHWFRQSHQSSLTVVHELARQTTDVQVLKSRKGTAAASYFYPAGLVVIGMKFKKMLAAEQAHELLRDYLPFLACAAQSHNALVESVAPADPADPPAESEAVERLPALQLTAGGTGYELAEVDV